MALLLIFTSSICSISIKNGTVVQKFTGAIDKMIVRLPNILKRRKS
jgi:hypothetical protein